MRNKNKNNWIQPTALGLSDGILNSLILAAAAIFRGTGGLSIGLALRVAAVASLPALFTVFISNYAFLRADLSRAEHELNITKAGRLASSNLGRRLTHQAVTSAVQAAIASFIGALIPLLASLLLPHDPWAVIIATLAMVGLLGAALARIVGGKQVTWFVVSIVAGAVIVALGVKLNIV